MKQCISFENTKRSLDEEVRINRMNLIYDWTKSYSLAFALYIVLCLIAAAACIVLMTRSRRS